jgi:GNAT superfamily N-acetyltransferase
MQSSLFFRLLNKNELHQIQELAHKIWPHTFKDILSKVQIDYMLNWMYSISKLEQQFDANHEFYVVSENEAIIGFAGIEYNYPTKESLRIHKIYLLPETQGKGIGKRFISFIEGLGRNKNLVQLHLNVNRFNDAVDFYKRVGFKIVKTEDNEIGSGYLMEDYVMVKVLKS